PGVAVRAAGVEHHRTGLPGGHHLLAPQHRVRLAAVRREHRGGHARRAVVDDQGDVRLAAGFEPGGHPGCPKPLRCGNCHGATPTVDSPAFSGRPRARFMDWTAAPAVPLVRLSMAATATSRPASASTVTCSCTALEPSTAEVAGQTPSGSRCTNG